MRLKEQWEKMRKNWLFSAAASAALGFLLLVMPGFLTKAAGYALGIGAILFGGSRVLNYFQEERMYPEFFRKDLMVGLLSVTLGILAMVKIDAMISLVPAAFGAVLFSNGVVGLQRALYAKKAAYSQWWLLLAFAVLTLALGLLLIINPFGVLKTAVRVIGAALMYEGITDALTMLIAGKKIDQWKEFMKKDA